MEAFLTMFTNERNVSSSTKNQALSALLFLYREVLDQALPRIDDLQRPTRVSRIPTVLTQDEVVGLLAQLSGVESLLGKLLYGKGMRFMEGLQLHVSL